jgi:hypothetical protein
MDGKKKIARLRNDEKWKARGFDRPKEKKERIAKIVDALKKRAPMPKPVKLQMVGLNALECKKPPAWMMNAIGQMIPVHQEPENPHPLKNPRLFIERLQKRGFVVLGSGCYSTVLAKPGSDRVIKVQRNMDNWIDYIQWAAKSGYSGGLAPKVYSWKRHDHWAVSVVERMEKTTYNTDYKKDDQSLIMTLLYPAKAGSVMAKLYMEDLVPGSVKFFEDLRENNFDGDIGSGNVMLRKDGSLCVTDPCAGHIRTTEKRFRTGANAPVHLEVFIARSHRYRSQRTS